MKINFNFAYALQKEPDLEFGAIYQAEIVEIRYPYLITSLLCI